MKKLSLRIIEVIIPALFIFIAAISRPADADLGWHLRYGQDFFHTFTIARTNTFSTDMAGFHWANISWGIDLMYYIFYALGGFWGLSLAGAGVVVLTFLFFAAAWELDYFEKALIFPVLAYIEGPINNVSFRGQLVSVMLLGLLIFLLSKYERGSRLALYAVPVLFLVWGNLHGQFVLGMAVLGLWVVMHVVLDLVQENMNFWSTLKKSRAVIIVGLFSLLTPLINPFGIAVYTDPLGYFNNPLLKDISEYVPPAELSIDWLNHILLLIASLTGLTWFVLKRKVSKISPTTLGGGMLYALSFGVKRYSWSAYYFAMPFLKPLAAFVKPESPKFRLLIPTFLFVLSIGVVVYLKASFSQYITMTWNDYCGYATDCSPQAARFLERLSNKGHLFTYYGWGGWLIWQYRDIKPSMDGRMHLWQDANGYSAFKVYYALEQNEADIDASNYDTVFMSNSKPLYSRLNQLASEGKWKKVYEDRTSGIFVRLDKKS
ncbi:MAG TPA: hypothetical protein VG935_01125 [Patescibacteria group bacterium]|nr:hypothetical protein [Patescibacteria group bacterium]